MCHESPEPTYRGKELEAEDSICALLCEYQLHLLIQTSKLDLKITYVVTRRTRAFNARHVCYCASIYGE